MTPAVCRMGWWKSAVVVVVLLVGSLAGAGGAQAASVSAANGGIATAAQGLNCGSASLTTQFGSPMIVHSCSGSGVVRYTLTCLFHTTVLNVRWYGSASRLIPYGCQNGTGAAFWVNYEIIE
ncbi:MAG: hypothetical protein ACRCZD_16070 [Phycicoccus sp.]